MLTNATDKNKLTKEECDTIVRNFSNVNMDDLSSILQTSPEAFVNLINASQSFLNEDDVLKIVGDRETIKAYKQILNRIEKEIDRGNLSPDERQKLIREMIDVAEKIAEEERRKEEFDKELRSQKSFFVICLILIFVLFVAFFIVAVIVPGIIFEIICIILFANLFFVFLLYYSYKKKELKQKYKSRK